MRLTSGRPPSSIPEETSEWTLPLVASRRVKASFDSTFVREVNGSQETYGQFWKRSRMLAKYLLDAGVKPGDCVVIFCSNSIPALHIWLAAGLIGAVDVSVNTALRGKSLSHVFTVSRPKVIISDSKLLPFLDELQDDLAVATHLLIVGDQPSVSTIPGRLGQLECDLHANIINDEVDPPLTLPEVKPSDPATVIFTSGTTGPAKGVTMPHAQVCLLALQTICEARMLESDVYFNAHPLFHIAGKFMGVLAVFAVGGILVLDKKFDADHWLSRVRQFGATLSIAHGPMIEMIYAQEPHEKDQDHSLTRLLCCPLPQGIGEEFQTRFGLKGIEMWGMTEIGCPAWTSRQEQLIAGSCGQVLTEWYELEIVDPENDRPVPAGATGEIVVRPKQPWTTMLGYMGMPDKTVEVWRNLWFHSGDMAYRDESGNLFYVDRKGDRIRRRAENVASYDIECAAAEHEGVKECAAVGVPSGYESDDDILLFLVPKVGAVIEYTEVLQTLAEKLPYYMVPRYVELVSELPRTPTNKLRKKELRDRGINPSTWDRRAAGINLRELTEKIRTNKS